MTAAAYTNNVAGATSTALYDLDTRRDLLVQQNPPNAGTLVTVGSLRLPVGSVAGFDIVTAGGTDTAYAALTFGVSPVHPPGPGRPRHRPDHRRRALPRSPTHASAAWPR